MLDAILRIMRKGKDRPHTREKHGNHKEIEKLRIENLYKTRPYMEAYCEHTNMRVAKDPHTAVGGMWDEIGKLQFDFMTRSDLTPRSSLLDIGCGTLRGGRFFISYLDAGGYTGFDVSPAAIEYAKGLIRDEGLENKQPRLLMNHNRDMRFREFAGESFDFILAQSVFTHLHQEQIQECFENVRNIMTESSKFFFTYNEAGRMEQRGFKDFSQPLSFFLNLAANNGFILEDHSENYSHPRSQKMLMIRRKSGG